MNLQPKIAIIVSRFNEEVTQKLQQGALERLIEQGVLSQNIKTVWVPGAVELPLIAQQHARLGYDAVICLGAVIRGETDHYDYVCQSVTYGCQRVALTNNIPVIFGVLTTNNEAEAWDRIGGAHGHKGRDCADAALEMVSQMRATNAVIQSEAAII